MEVEIVPYGYEWNLIADRMARNFAPGIYPCKKCKMPVMDGYCCEFCGDIDPKSEE